MHVTVGPRKPRAKGFLKPVSIHETLIEPAAVLWDCNGVLVDDEKFQELGWHRGIEQVFKEITPPETRQRAHLHVRSIFQSGHFADFSGGLWRIFEQHCAGLGISTANELDGHLAMHRDQFVLSLVDSGEICLAPGVENILRDFEILGLPVGLFTANNRRPVEKMFAKFFGKPAGCFKERLFGKEFPEGTRSKPYSDGYRLLAEKLGVPFNQCVVVEDHLASIRNAIVDGIGGAIWVHKFRNPKKTWRWVRRNFGELANKIIMVKDPSYLEV